MNTAVREGEVDPTPHTRARGKQAAAASGFLARLPTFPRASMDEVVDIRSELDRPLVRFRAEMVTVAQDLNVDAFSPEFEEASQDAWTAKVRPALLELEELVKERGLQKLFAVRAPGGGMVGSASGLIAGIMTHAPLIGAGTLTAATTAAVVSSAVLDQVKLDQQLRTRPYYLLHRVEQLLEPRQSLSHPLI